MKIIVEMKDNKAEFLFGTVALPTVREGPAGNGREAGDPQQRAGGRERNEAGEGRQTERSTGASAPQ
jgi:hypothetical protein